MLNDDAVSSRFTEPWDICMENKLASRTFWWHGWLTWLYQDSLDKGDKEGKGHIHTCNLFNLTTRRGGGGAGIPDDLNLGLDDKGVGNSEAFQHFGQLHELLPAPVMLLLAEPVQRVCRKESNNMRQGYRTGLSGMALRHDSLYSQ